MSCLVFIFEKGILFFFWKCYDTDSNSALSLISSGSSDEHIEMLRGGIVQKLLEEKWKTFGYVRDAACLSNDLSFHAPFYVVVHLT